MTTTIRKATEDDLLSLMLLAKEFSKEAPETHKWDKDKTYQFLKSALTNDNTEIFVIDRDGDLLGSLVAIVTQMYMSNKVVATELAWFVSKDERGTPSSVKLIKTFESWAKSIGANYVVMADLPEVADLGSLYLRLGYGPSETSYIKEV